eukprot:gene38405-47416_t
MVVMVSESLCSAPEERQIQVQQFQPAPNIAPSCDSPSLHLTSSRQSAVSANIMHHLDMTTLSSKSISTDSFSPYFEPSVDVSTRRALVVSDVVIPVKENHSATLPTASPESSSNVSPQNPSHQQTNTSTQHEKLVPFSPLTPTSITTTTSTPKNKSDMKALLHYLSINVKKTDVSVADYLINKQQSKDSASPLAEPKKVVMIQDYKQRGDVMSHFNNLFRPSTVEMAPPPPEIVPVAQVEVPSSSSATRRRIDSVKNSRDRDVNSSHTPLQQQKQQHKFNNHSFGKLPSMPPSTAPRSVSTASSSAVADDSPIVQQQHTYVVENKFYTTFKKANRVKTLLDEVIRLKLLAVTQQPPSSSARHYEKIGSTVYDSQNTSTGSGLDVHVYSSADEVQNGGEDSLFSEDSSFILPIAVSNSKRGGEVRRQSVDKQGGGQGG